MATVILKAPTTVLVQGKIEEDCDDDRNCMGRLYSLSGCFDSLKTGIMVLYCGKSLPYLLVRRLLTVMNQNITSTFKRNNRKDLASSLGGFLTVLVRLHYALIRIICHRNETNVL